MRPACTRCREGDKVHHPCPRRGSQRHGKDAVHYKACGLLLGILDDDDT